MRMLLSTKIPYLWEIYSTIVSLAPVVETGYSLVGAASFLIGAEINCDHETFWNAMRIFLLENNLALFKKLKPKKV